MKGVKRIFVPVDFAECSKKALEVALALAETDNAEVDVLHVWYLADFAAPDLPIAGPNGRVSTLDEVARREAKAQLSDFMSGIEVPAGVRMVPNIIFGVPYAAILERAKDYDLVVMGTHGRKGLMRALLGSVTDKVVRESPTPVLVVNAQAETREG